MFSVGLDVDTTITLVSINVVTYFIIIWLFAGKFIKRVSPPTISVVGKSYNSSFIFLYLFYFYLYFLLYFYFIFKVIKVKNKIYNIFYKIFELNIKQSADNSLVLSKEDKNNDEVIFHFNKLLISNKLFISDHLKKHKKPESLEEIGYYIAGLIEGSSHIRFGEINIVLNKRDVSLAYYLKKVIGYGSVRLDTKNNACYYSVFKKEGRDKILNLINGKLRGYEKIEQFKKHNYDKEFNITILPPANFDLLINY
jgi:hypothetical protein